MENFDNIQDLFDYIIAQSTSIDMAEAEFSRTLVDDPSLRPLYRAYCQEVGTTERNGFVEYCETFMADRNEVWNNLQDYDDIE